MNEEKKTVNMEKFLTFTLADEHFALDITSVREIQDMTDVTRIPQSPEFMRGVVNLRGNAVPVIDLRLKFGMGVTEQTINTRIVIIDVVIDDEMIQLGALADSVKEVLELDASQIDPPPKMGTGLKTDYLKGIAKNNGAFILVLDIDKVFSASELAAIKETEEEKAA